MTDNQIFPIKVQQAITRLNPPGRPDIEQYLHAPMEQGRMLEKPLGDGLFYLQERQKDLQEKINHYMNMNTLAVDGQFPDSIRPAKYVVDSVKIVQEIQKYTQETLNVAKAINETIGQYQSLKQNIQGYFQERSNALATLLNEICNFNLPSLPSIPNFFGNFTFDGFTFPKGAFKFQVSFDKNFAFSQCKLRGGDLDIFRNYPKTIDWGGTVPVTIPVYRPPFSGVVYTGTPQHPESIKDTAYYSSFDPQTDYIPNTGFPNPQNIISDYHIPVSQYKNIISSLTGFAPNVENIYTNNLEPNQVAAWLLYLRDTRVSRGGDWLPNLQSLYDTYITPSLEYLDTNGIVWNNKIGGPGVQQGDTNIPIIQTIINAPSALYRGQLYYLLTWIEASLLGYTRNRDFDIFSIETGTSLDQVIKNLVSDFTGTDLDYMRLEYNSAQDQIFVLDSSGKAQYPSILKVANSLANNVFTVIETASKQIDSVATFTSSRPQFRVVYDSFGNQIIIDKYSQFWKEFVYNWNQLVSTQDSYVLGFILRYPEVLNEAINPLASSKSNYNRVVADATTRNRSWIPGTPILPVYTPIDLSLANPIPSNGNGWNGDTFDQDTYLLRADIQGLTIPQKLTMMQINKAYSSFRSTVQAITSEIDQSIASASSVSQTQGFRYDIASSILGIPASGEFPAFTQEEYNNSGYYVDGITFNISTSGSYALSTSISWGTNSDIGIRYGAIIKNGSQIIDTFQQDQAGPGPVTIQSSITVDLVQGDTLKVKVYHSCPNPQSIDSGYFMGTMLGAAGSTGGTNSVPPQGSTTGTINVITKTDLSEAACLKINQDNTVSILNPADASTIPFIDAIALGSATAGNSLDVGNIHGTVYQFINTNFTTGPVFLGLNGYLTQTMPDAVSGYAWYVQVGRALNKNTIILDSQLPIKLV